MSNSQANIALIFIGISIVLWIVCLYQAGKEETDKAKRDSIKNEMEKKPLSGRIE